MRVCRFISFFLTFLLLIAFNHPLSAASPWKRQMRIGLYHLGVPRQFQVYSADGPLEVYDPFSRKVLLSGPASSATLVCQNGVMQVFMDPQGSVTAPYPLVFTSLGAKNPFLHIRTPPYRGETYRGSLAIAPWRDRLFAVNLVGLEEYLRSVVPAEIGGNAPTSALEAQSVAARSYALRNHRRHSPNGFDLCDEVHCQVYRGLRTETPASGKAVLRTSGWVLTHSSFLANTVYHANCGGQLASSQNVWKGAAVPYLVAHPDRVGNDPFFCAPEAKKTPSPRRTASAATSLAKKAGSAARVSATACHHPSRGHRVGLCQDGAIGMAKRGYNAVAIMNFYYPGTLLSSVQSNTQLAHLTRSPGSGTPQIAAPRFGSGPLRVVSSIVRTTPIKLITAHEKRTHTPRPTTTREPSAFSLNLRKWFWTALSPHGSPRDIKLVSAPMNVALRSGKRTGKDDAKKKNSVSAAPKTAKRGSGTATSRKSTSRNARR